MSTSAQAGPDWSQTYLANVYNYTGTNLSISYANKGTGKGNQSWTDESAMGSDVNPNEPVPWYYYNNPTFSNHNYTISGNINGGTYAIYIWQNGDIIYWSNTQPPAGGYNNGKNLGAKIGTPFSIYVTWDGSSLIPSLDGPLPSLSASSPSSGRKGATVPVILSGSYLAPVQIIDAGTDITVGDIQPNLSGTTVAAAFAISTDATPATVNVTLTTQFGTSDPVSFTINPD
jgi:hypothetical protein